MDVRVGTSGHAYKQWVGPFDPQQFAVADSPGPCAATLRSVEINNVFSQIPKGDVMQKQRSQVLNRFRSVLTCSGRVTHKKRLHELDGPTRLPLSPHPRWDVERLRSFLDTFSA